ncbi:hypothetical protein 2 [Beihai picorna-like virus 79]|uniref:hypothetical protein 2 n=1 Tax=Beihai picorna-like virus 79 TaxID=1922626 RepID=UPI000909AD5D|nr:hypothetical protein 2 [Beihai picorna-like virus 79]APG76740.1 hypothetical protein 2 [Beihai picorna-like virus 79]
MDMQDMAVAINTVNEETAAFEGEAFAPSAVMRAEPQFDRLGDDMTADVRRILARPKFLTKRQLLSDPKTGFLQDYNLSRKFYDDNFKISERFAGSLGIRFTTCFRIVVAASPQVGGRLRAFYNPVAVADDDNNVITTYKDMSWANKSPTAYTQLPGAELDLEQSTALDYRIPYTHFLEYMPLGGQPIAEDGICLGTFNITDYLKIAFDASTSVPYLTVYTWLEDIEVIGARNPQLEATWFGQANSEPNHIFAGIVRGGAIVEGNAVTSPAHNLTTKFLSDGNFIISYDLTKNEYFMEMTVDYTDTDGDQQDIIVRTQVDFDWSRSNQPVYIRFNEGIYNAPKNNTLKMEINGSIGQQPGSKQIKEPLILRSDKLIQSTVILTFAWYDEASKKDWSLIAPISVTSSDFYTDVSIVEASGKHSYIDGTNKVTYNVYSVQPIGVPENGYYYTVAQQGPNLGYIEKYTVNNFPDESATFYNNGITANYDLTTTDVDGAGTFDMYVEAKKGNSVGYSVSLSGLVYPEPKIESQSGMAEDIERDGPFSGPLYKLGKAASLVGSAIPLISSVTTPLAWATRVGANMASAFGYSRPVQCEKTDRFWNTQNHFQNNADGPDGAFNLGLLQANSVCPDGTVGGTNVDEMAISYLVSKPAAIDRFTVDTAATGRVYQLGLCPDSMYFNADYANSAVSHPPFTWDSDISFPGAVVNPAPTFWLGQMFTYFRGGFKFRIKCNKTRFHGGRMMLMFTPYSYQDFYNKVLFSPDANDPNMDDDLYGQSIVWDLRESSEIEFECPFIALSPYLPTAVPYGTFSISVIDNINAPANVMQELSFVVESSAMPDFELAFPVQKDYIPNPANDLRTYGSTYAPVTTSELEIESQSGVPIPLNDKSCQCIGEKIMSVKQLLSRAEWSVYSAMKKMAEPYVPGGLKGCIRMYPWYSPRNYFGFYDNTCKGYYKLSTHALIASAFAFARGGTCYDNNAAVAHPMLFSYNDLYRTANSSIGAGSNLFEVTNFMKAKDPFYSQTTKVPTLPSYNPVQISSTKYNFSPYRKPEFVFLFGQDDDITSSRAADDAQLGFFLCAPQMMYTSLTNSDPDTFTVPIADGFDLTCLGSVDGTDFERVFQVTASEDKKKKH